MHEIGHLRLASVFRRTFCRFTSRWTIPARAQSRGPGDLGAKVDRLALRQRPLALEKALEVLPVDVLEDDETGGSSCSPRSITGDDVRVRELRDRASLAAEALDVVAVGRDCSCSTLIATCRSSSRSCAR